MEYKRLIAILSLMLTTILFTGCNNEPPKPQAVVINIRTISEAEGINERIKKQSETINQAISEEIKALSDKLSEELEDEKARLGDNPSEQDNKKIQALQEQQRKQINRARFAGNAKLAKEKSEIWRSFSDGVVSVAKTVALEQHGASIILKAQAGVFWSDEVDITNEVIERMQRLKDEQAADIQNQ